MEEHSCRKRDFSQFKYENRNSFEQENQVDKIIVNTNKRTKKRFKNI